jgi:hypothetical protein
MDRLEARVNALIQSGRWADAELANLGVLAGSPESILALNRGGQISEKLGNAADAVAYSERVLTLSSDAGDAAERLHAGGARGRSRGVGHLRSVPELSRRQSPVAALGRVPSSVPRVSWSRITGMACCRPTRRTAWDDGATQRSFGGVCLS